MFVYKRGPSEKKHKYIKGDNKFKNWKFKIRHARSTSEKLRTEYRYKTKID